MKVIHKLILIPVFALGAAAQAADWTMDPAASKLEFVASYEGSDAPGQFNDFGTELRFDPQQPAEGSLRVSVVMTSADMGNDDINENLPAPEWFDSGAFPRAVFEAKSIRSDKPGHYVASGTLTLKGIKQKVEVPFSWQIEGDTAVLEGATSIDRTRFKVGTGSWAKPSPIGLNVVVRYRVRFTR